MTWKTSREKIARELLSEAMRIQGLLEAFILDGTNYKEKIFSENPGLQENHPNTEGLFLKKVEVRMVLDEAPWNYPEGCSQEKRYDMNGERRTWIVRDKILPVKDGTIGARLDDYHPALITSKAFEELWAWVEQVACARYGWWIFKNLSHDGYYILKPLFGALMDKHAEINETHPLSNRAKRLLNKYKDFLEKYPLSNRERLLNGYKDFLNKYRAKSTAYSNRIKLFLKRKRLIGRSEK